MTIQPDGFHVAIDRHDSGVHIKINGELDLDSGAWLTHQTSSLDGSPPDTIIDLSGVTFLDGAGLRALLSTRDRLQEHGCRVRFVDPSRPVARIFELLDIDPA